MMAISAAPHVSKRVYVSRGMAEEDLESMADVVSREADTAKRLLNVPDEAPIALDCLQQKSSGRWIFAYTALSTRTGLRGRLERFMDGYSVAYALAQWKRDTGYGTI